MTNEFLKGIEQRRSYYAIGKDITISDDRIREILEQALLHTPSAFHSQSTRLILLLGLQHDRFWNMVKEELRTLVPENQFKATSDKIDSFMNGYGTVLYFEDVSVVRGLQKNFPLYEGNIPIWSQQSNAMHQFVIWTAFELEGLGASLQHYNEIIEDEIKEEWKIPGNWKLIAQMPFGNPLAQPDPKEFEPLDYRLRIEQ